jgi:hypothetical protein
LYDQVEPEPEIVVKPAAKAGCAGASIAVHNAATAATVTAINRARVLRTRSVNM